jgi:hypothetical protein
VIEVQFISCSALNAPAVVAPPYLDFHFRWNEPSDLRALLTRCIHGALVSRHSYQLEPKYISPLIAFTPGIDQMK